MRRNRNNKKVWRRECDNYLKQSDPTCTRNRQTRRACGFQRHRGKTPMAVPPFLLPPQLFSCFLFSQPVIIPHPLCLQAAGTAFLRPGWLGRRDWEKPFGGEPHTDVHFQSGSAHSGHPVLGTGCSGLKRRAACGVGLSVHGPEPSEHFLLVTLPSVLWVVRTLRLARTLVPVEGWLEERSEGTGECPWFYVRIWKQPRSGIALGSPRSRMSGGTGVPGGLAKTRRAGQSEPGCVAQVVAGAAGPGTEGQWPGWLSH